MLMLFIVLFSVVTTFSNFQATFPLISPKLFGIYTSNFTTKVRKIWQNFWYQNQSRFEKKWGGWCCGSCQALLNTNVARWNRWNSECINRHACNKKQEMGVYPGTIVVLYDVPAHYLTENNIKILIWHSNFPNIWYNWSRTYS